MKFSKALEELESGKKLRRVAWENCFITYIAEDCYEVGGWAEKVINEIFQKPFIGIKDMYGNFVPWVPTQLDMFSNDWVVAEQWHIT